MSVCMYVCVSVFLHLCMSVCLSVCIFFLRPPCGQICDATLPAQPILDPASHALERPNSGEEGNEGHPTPSLKVEHTPWSHSSTDTSQIIRRCQSKLQLEGMVNCSKVEPIYRKRRICTVEEARKGPRKKATISSNVHDSAHWTCIPCHPSSRSK